MDECRGKAKPSSEKRGLLRGARYPREGALGALSEDAVEKILRLIDGANRMWMQCCVKLVPCIDEGGRYLFKALDPYELPLRGARGGRSKRARGEAGWRYNVSRH
ncbi:MAG: hypothetical protein QFX33_02175 [Candidatus Nezhaarchaeota archaeon]|nr:hypothetical protein [Candidatus Nezhaarchaeota archaeon]